MVFLFFFFNDPGTPRDLPSSPPRRSSDLALGPAELVPAVEAILFRETTPLGVRRWQVERRALRREPHQVETPWGNVAGVVAWPDDAPPRFSPEYESCRQVAEANNVPLKAVYEAAQKAYGSRSALSK